MDIKFKAFKFIAENKLVDKFTDAICIFYREQTDEFKYITYNSEHDTVFKLNAESFKNGDFKRVLTIDDEMDIVATRYACDGDESVEDAFEMLEFI